MSQDEMPFSSRAADQAWFSMLLVNDPNSALVGALRPSLLHPIWVALRRPFERGVPPLVPVSDAVEQIPGLRPRPARWLGAGLLLALGVGLAGGGWQRARMAVANPTASAAVQEERIGTTTLQARPAPSPERAVNMPSTSAEASPGAATAAVQQRDAAAAVAASVAPPAYGPSTSAVKERSAAPPRDSTASVPRATSVKKKAAARRVRRALGNALARSR